MDKTNRAVKICRRLTEIAERKHGFFKGEISNREYEELTYEEIELEIELEGLEVANHEEKEPSSQEPE